MTDFTLLDNRAVLALMGKDALTFLQGLFTNDVYEATESRMVYTLMLTPQGRFLYDFFIIKNGDTIYLDHESKFTSEIILKFNFYKMRSDVKITDVTDSYSILALDDMQGSMIFKDPRSEKLGSRVYVEKPHLQDFIAAHNLKENKSMYTDIIFKNLIPEPHQDMIQEKSFPLEYGIDNFNAISFTKGCYIGQEPTARIKTYGVIRKKLDQFVTDQDASTMKTGDDITIKNKNGIFCSAHGKIVRVLVRLLN